MTTYLQRPIFFVKNLSMTLTIFKDLLGFTENYRLQHEVDTFSHRLFGLDPGIPTTFVTLDLPDQERCLALLAPEVDADWEGVKPTAGLVIRVSSVDDLINRAQDLGLRCEPIKRELHPDNGPPRTEGAFYDCDENPIVVFDLNPKEDI
jgi:catechol 2,3-dioxygenase-like lactoylglutathione lyase family enzyme